MRNRTVSILAFFAVIVLSSVYFYFNKSIIADGTRYYFLFDDAMISMRYAYNFANGDGLVWNVGERVEGYSNFLWVLVMGIVHFLPVSISKTSFVVLVINSAILAAGIFPLVRLVKILGGSKYDEVISIIAYSFNMDIFWWSNNGMETTLIAVVVLISVCRILEEKNDITTYLIIGALSLIRADGIVLTFLLCLLSVFVNGKKELARSVVSLLPFMVHLAFRMSYYGDILPNTAYLKSFDIDKQLLNGSIYLYRFVMGYYAFLIMGIAAVIVLKERRILLLVSLCSLYCLYVFSIGGDAFTNNRFFVAIIPVVIVIGVVSSSLLSSGRVVSCVICSVLIISSPLIPIDRKILPPAKENVGNLEIALLLKKATPTDARIADSWAGSTIYFSERYGIDLLGKSDKHIARMRQVSEGRIPGHNKFDYAYSLGVLKPNVVIANFVMPIRPPAGYEKDMRTQAVGNYAFIGKLYFNDEFIRNYRSNIGTNRTWRTIFIRKGA